MNALSEYDLRQIRLIEKKIGLFEINKLDLCDLVNELGGLLNVIESAPAFWKDKFQTEINNLEMIQDSIEDGSISKWNGDFKEDLNKSISNLKSLSTGIIEEYLKISDPNILESAIKVDSNWLICPKCNDPWKTNSSNAMTVCPKCECAFHNPRIKPK